MVSVLGTYQNGILKLKKNYSTIEPVNVIVTFLENVETITDDVIKLSDFSFSKSQQNLQNFTGSFAEEVVNERRVDL